MSELHRRQLPDYSTLLAGHTPPDDVGFRSDRLQVWYNNSLESWTDPVPHAHTGSDEVFVVLRGSLVVEVEGERFTVGPREFCAFPKGAFHSIVAVNTPIETLMIRAPSVEDKVGMDGSRLDADTSATSTTS